MPTIKFKKANCKNCYKCIRSCPVKSISFKDNQAQIIEDRCILCGKCLQVCPQNAKSVNEEIDYVKGMLAKKLKVYASIAPSFGAAFNVKDERCIVAAFKKLGFTYVEETAIGASKVSLEYEKLLLEGKMRNIISTACPAITNLVQKYYPELIDQLAPVVSPMIAHAKMLKEMYGSRIKVVFVGPCLAKKEEYKDEENEDLIASVLTFEEMEKWLKEENISFDLDEYDEKDVYRLNSRFYPAPGGIIKSLSPGKKYNYGILKFDGIERCMDILEQLKTGDIKGYFIEMNSCTGGCLGGPALNTNSGGFLKIRERLIQYISKCSMNPCISNNYNSRISMSKKFIDKSKFFVIPEEEKIGSILRKIGKFSKDDELNCSACGYSTCREKAIAVYNNKAELYMCLPYMMEKAESISNIILNSTPNAIIALSEDLIVQQFNLKAQTIFNFQNDDLKNKTIFDFINCIDILNVCETRQSLLNKKYTYEKYNIIVEQSILYIKQNHMIVLIMKDITKQEEDTHQTLMERRETIEIAQKVIDKQMRVAQEIASLLGETTAETKVALTKLKTSVQAKIGENK